MKPLEEECALGLQRGHLGDGKLSWSEGRARTPEKRRPHGSSPARAASGTSARKLQGGSEETAKAISAAAWLSRAMVTRLRSGTQSSPDAARCSSSPAPKPRARISTWSQQGPRTERSGRGRAGIFRRLGGPVRRRRHAAVGGAFDGEGSGAAWLFTRDGSGASATWAQLGPKLTGGAEEAAMVTSATASRCPGTAPRRSWEPAATTPTSAPPGPSPSPR